jgi:hypothetical protein
VAEDARHSHRDPAFDDVEIAMADSRRSGSRQDFVRAGLVDVDFFDFEGGVELA